VFGDAVVLERHDQLDLPLYRRIAVERERVTVADELLDGVRRSRRSRSCAARCCCG
jgi:hypothetical protein